MQMLSIRQRRKWTYQIITSLLFVLLLSLGLRELKVGKLIIHHYHLGYKTENCPLLGIQIKEFTKNY